MQNLIWERFVRYTQINPQITLALGWTPQQERVQEGVRQRQQLLVEAAKFGCKKCVARLAKGTRNSSSHDQHCPLSAARARSTISDVLQAIKKDGKVGDKFWLPIKGKVSAAEIPNLPNESNEIKVYKIASQTLKSNYAVVDKALKEEVNWDYTRVKPYTYGVILHLYEFVDKSDFPFNTQATPITRAKPRQKKVKVCACCEIELNEGNCNAHQLKKGSGKGKCKSCTSKRGPAPGTTFHIRRMRT